MRRIAGRALVAMSDPETRMRCARAFTEAEWDVQTTGDGREALRILHEHPSDALVLQLPLKVYDGLEVLRRIPLCGLYLVPGVVASLHPGMEQYAQRAKELGAAVCLDSRADLQEIIDACANIKAEDRLYASAGREEEIHRLMTSLAFDCEHAGTAYLETALLYALSDGRMLRDLAHRLYPAAAKRHGVKPEQVERGIRHAIERAWSRGSVEKQYALFENTIDEKRGKPTNGGMIARATELLRAKEGTV